MKRASTKKCLAIGASILLAVGIWISPSMAALQDPAPPSNGGGGLSIPLLGEASTINAYGSGYVYDMQLVGNTLYTAGIYYDPVFDVTNSYNPVKVYEIPHVHSAAHWAIEVADGRYYGLGTYLDVWDASVWAYLGGKSVSGEMQLDLDVVGNTAYVISDVGGQMAGQAGVLYTFNVTNPSNIQLLGWTAWSGYAQNAHPPNPTNILVAGNFAFIGQDGLKVYNITTPASPSAKAEFDAKSHLSVQDVHPQDDMVKKDYQIFKAHRNLGIFILDTRYIEYLGGSDIVLTGLIGEPTLALGDVIAFDIVGPLAFVATGKDQTLKIINISNIRKPQVVASRSISHLFDTAVGNPVASLEVEVDGNRKRVYVGGEKAVGIYDVTMYIPTQAMK
ncbi:MAG: hypothetical protein ABH845_05560 [Candidatus Omnitrophota bacterium]